MRVRTLLSSVFCLWIGAPCSYLRAQDGEYLFKAYCAICHESSAPVEVRGPERDALKQMTPEHILQVLETGAMKVQAAERSRTQRRVLAEYLSGKRLGSGPAERIPRSAFCNSTAEPFRNSVNGPAWNGWSPAMTNTRFQSANAAKLTAEDFPRLKLKWAFGYPGAASAGTQPTVVGGRVYVGTAEGDVYSLDGKTGCVHRVIETEAAVRSAINIGEAANGRLAAYFGDQSANVYAVDAETGKSMWKTKVDDNWRAAVTGAPALYAGRLYVPVSSREESQVANPKYPCCQFRGSVLALDASNGELLWKTYTIQEKAHEIGKNAIGTQLWGPSGSAVWNTPTVDLKRGALYFGTGNNYSTPGSDASDSVVAVDMKTGKIRWIHQVIERDVWNGSCGRADRNPAVCEPDAPDADFSSSPALVQLKNGRQIIVAGNKGATVFALDPDAEGKLIWQQSIGKSMTGGGILWGSAVDGDYVYAANAFNDPTNPEASGGLAALELASGRTVWKVYPPPCGERKPCKPAQPAAVTAIPGVVFSATMDGQLRAYSARDGKIIWEHNTVQDYQTVNGVRANGGSISNGGPTIVNRMLFANSGYSHHGGLIPGNVLLAFGLE